MSDTPENSPIPFQASPDSIKAAALQRDVEALMKKHGLPALCIVLTPDNEGAARSSYLLRTSPKNIFAIIPVCTAYFKELATDAAISEMHRREKNN